MQLLTSCIMVPFVVLPLAFSLKDLSVSVSVALLPGTSAIAVTHPSHQVLAVAAAVAEVAAESRRHPKALQVMFTEIIAL